MSEEIISRLDKIEEMLEEITKTLQIREFKTADTLSGEQTAPPQPEEKPPPVAYAPPLKSELARDGLDFTVLDYLKYGTVIKGKGYLDGEVWGNYNKILRAAGYVYDKNERAWIFQQKNQGEEQGEPKKTQPPTKDKAGQATAIFNLTPGMKSATVEGTVISDPSVKDFNKKDGSHGTVGSFMISDGSGSARISFWDDAASKVLDLQQGDKVKVTSLLVKEPYNNVVQLNAGKFTNVIKL